MNDLTSEEMAALRVPLLKLPGMPLHGCPVIRATGNHPGWGGLVYDASGTDRLIIATSATFGGARPGEWPWDDGWVVDLADASTRDRIARWLAGRVGLELGATAPSWGWCPPVMTWRLCAEHGEWDAPRALFDDAFWDRHLGNLRPLPDGALYVTALALAMAAAHLGAS